ncbi:molybdate ABC transporter ATP-binding protein ModF [Alteromonas gilva]|uniref:Molybdate ABC transporter ATP-binding protein ModF n=1 Tax=Alteromonas gilva TaxID=2987522 RepID=A0ABT5L6G1_9ALTE|nr:molybdate ABC transporter ATP-binding protein ModF [Alteromonas gilva]MDC8832621.1 molybdate ABC transporter ATP-binding protein ModF [Alteromonas gilva]
MAITLSDLSVRLTDSFTADFAPLRLEPGEHTVITGINGSGKSILAAVIAGQGKVVHGERHIDGTVGWVSIAQQQAIVAAERRKDDADILDIVPTPSCAREIILQGINTPSEKQHSEVQRLSKIFGIQHLLERDFIALSSGETRKVLLVQQLLGKPDWLVLDEPFDGLDAQTAERFSILLDDIKQDCTIIMVVNRQSEIPQWAQRLLFLSAGQIGWQIRARQLNADALQPLRQILHIQQNVTSLPEQDATSKAPALSEPNAPLVRLRSGRVAWGDDIIFEKLDWTIMPGEHWQVTGPNGSGKTCLLTLITGDNPQCYSNDLNVFGFQRGSGESIWQIKQHLGIVSNSLHLQYRVNCSAIDVVCSGFYDSIGLYQSPTRQQRTLALQWLETIALASEAHSPFQSLSYGDQRLLLIARAMVKHPSLLILDEPCNGLDDINRHKVLAMMELLARSGHTTLLYVNHHSEDTIASISRCLDMRDYRPTS